MTHSPQASCLSFLPTTLSLSFSLSCSLLSFSHFYSCSYSLSLSFVPLHSANYTPTMASVTNGAASTDFTVKAGLAQMLKGGVIMDVVNAEQVCNCRLYLTR